MIDVAKDTCKLFDFDNEKVIKFVENCLFNDHGTLLMMRY